MCDLFSKTLIRIQNLNTEKSSSVRKQLRPNDRADLNEPPLSSGEPQLTSA